MKKILLLAMIVLLCTATVSGTGEQEAKEKKVTLTMWTFLDIKKESPREVALRKIIESFHEKNPNIEVIVEPQVWNTMPTKFFMGDSTGDAPDICWINTANPGCARTDWSRC